MMVPGIVEKLSDTRLLLAYLSLHNKTYKNSVGFISGSSKVDYHI